MGESQTTGQHLTSEEWENISRRLREPFDPRDVDFRVQGKVSGETGKAQVVAYIDARAVQDRLDAVVGAGNWSFDWTPLVIDNGEVMVAKGVLTVCGVSKADAGSASNFEQTLGAVSHCFKRAAVHWGIGRYLYDLPMAWVPVERGGRISDAVLGQLRARLPRPIGSAGGTGPNPGGSNHIDPNPARIEAGREADDGERLVQTPVSRRSAQAGQGAQETPRLRPEPTIRETAPAQATRQPGPASAASAAASGPREQPATEQQVASIRKLCTALGKPDPEPGLTYNQAKLFIAQLSAEYQRARKAS